MCERDLTNHNVIPEYVHDMNADPEALQEIIEMHLSIDPPAEPIVLSNDVYDQMFTSSDYSATD